MGRIEGCLISVEVAKRLQQFMKDLPEDAFRCPQCHQPLTPVGGSLNRFEHKPGASPCLLKSSN
jgi:hypothetical protein